MIESNYVGKFTNYPIIVCDEADTMESIISSTVSLLFNVAQMKKIGVPPPEYSSFNAKGSDEAWDKWCKVAVNAVRGYKSEFKSNSKENTNNAVDYIKYVKELQRLDELESRIIRFAESYDETWIVEKKKKSNFVVAWNMKPTWLTKDITEKYFFRHGRKFLMMSATLPEQHVMAGLLGLEPGDLDIHEMPSLFPVENRQIYLHPVANMNTSPNPDDNERNIQAVIAKVKQLLYEHRDEKGMIHTVSWMLNKRIMEIGDPRLITHEPLDKSEKLLWHYHSKNPTVFVSPSSMRGVDMIGDRARFNIIIKAPWPNLGDKLVKTRLFGNKGLGKIWYSNQCAMSMIQAAGRICRSETDWGKTYILDQSAVNLLQSHRYLFPKYILEALTW
jgi:Rad3-related DNA helicase